MRIVEKMLYGLGGLIGLVLLFITFCHFNPEITQKQNQSIQSEEQQKVVQPQLSVNPKPIESMVVENTVLDQKTYVAPNESQMTIPAELLQLAGMHPIEGKEVSVSENRAKELQKDLTIGRSGEEYSYDQQFYPYYYMLDQTEKSLYKQLHANAEDLTERFLPIVKECTTGQLKRAFMALCNDHPELFWLNTSYGCYVDPSGQIIEIDLSFNHTAANLEVTKPKFEEAAQELVYGSRGSQGDYGRERYVHDTLAKNTTYDLNAPANQSAYSALVDGRTVCAGYARAFQYVMQKLGIPCFYCAGYSGQEHAWNIVKLDGEYYNVDVTWDDTNPMTYDYFNCSDSEYASTHARRDLSVNLPPCLGEKYSDLEKSPQEPEKEETSKDKIEMAQQVAQEAAQQIETQKVEQVAEEIKQEVVTQEQVTITIDRNNQPGHIIYDDIGEYYVECAHLMMEDDDNSINFTLYLADEQLWEEVKKGYQDGTYENAYINRVLAERHMSKCNVTITGEPQKDGTVKVRHVFTLRK